MHDRHDEAHEVLKRLHRTKGDEHDTMARKEYYQMKKQVDLDRQIRQTTSSFELFKTAPNRRRALVGFLLMWNNQFTGELHPAFALIYDIECSRGTDYRQLWDYSIHFSRYDWLLAASAHILMGYVNLPRQHLLCLLRREIRTTDVPPDRS